MKDEVRENESKFKAAASRFEVENVRSYPRRGSRVFDIGDHWCVDA